MKALDFGKKYIDISDDDINIIFHSCKTVLYHNSEIWVKKDNQDLFDVPMGSLHGAEICELVDLLLLDKMRKIVNPRDCGLYRDDGLLVVQKSACEMERFSKSLRKLFLDNGFKITIEIGLKRVEFLDIIMDLNSDSFRPFRKPNSEIIYMSSQSNHPDHIKKQIPTMVNKRLCSLSKSKTDFNYIKDDYEQALKKSHYDVKLEHLNSSEHTRCNPGKKKRRRKIIYFQPPFSKQLKTPIGKLFLRLIKKHFNKDHQLYKILNERCLKLSYCCMNNIKDEIAAHNKKILNYKKDEDNTRLCNCRLEECPMEGKCLKSNIIYQAEIKSNDGNSRTYIGSAGNTFKERYRGHKSSFNNRGKRYTTELSKYYWKLIDEGETPTITWSIVAEIKSGRGGAYGCNLCNTERYQIARANKERSLNKRNELKRACPHYSKEFF